MKFAITSKGDSKSNTLMHKMRTYLQDFNLIYDEDEPDIVISVGGDGTLLYAFHRYSRVWIRRPLWVYIQVTSVFMQIGFLKRLRSLSLPLPKHLIKSSNILLLEVIIRYQHGGKETVI